MKLPHHAESPEPQQSGVDAAEAWRVMQAEDYMAVKFAEAGYDDTFPPGVIPQVCGQEELIWEFNSTDFVSNIICWKSRSYITYNY